MPAEGERVQKAHAPLLPYIKEQLVDVRLAHALLPSSLLGARSLGLITIWDAFSPVSTWYVTQWSCVTSWAVLNGR